MSLEGKCKMGQIWISDLFPHEYIYKPLIYDLVEIHNDDEYKVLKRIKQARYIHNSIWREDNRARALLRNVLTGEIVIDSDYIKPFFSQEQLELKKEIYSGYHDPVVYRVRENTLFDVYFGSDLETKNQICENRIIKLAGKEFEIVSVEPIVQNTKPLLILQTDGPVRESYRIPTCSRSVFRVRYDIKNKTQYFKAGSVLDIDACTADHECVDWYPYVIFMEE
jgi:hypothetical protein